MLNKMYFLTGYFLRLPDYANSLDHRFSTQETFSMAVHGFEDSDCEYIEENEGKPEIAMYYV